MPSLNNGSSSALTWLQKKTLIYMHKHKVRLIFAAGLEKNQVFFKKNQKTRFFWFKPGFFGLNQVFFQSYICVFMNENSHIQ